ncbi:LOW QUALITY PROTEIN: heterogeneous nuclear ribonucleoprotein Q-like [Dioscorea cayenensis subsp. rotundata]|uniref:LOW QUALITY PROTEIN: heterogeneous nuclear ribonucleoprotein Q-like n=1 Tax=Dioscorea cayennensis subsp. rotundata TaxID=55577 RepID=A0AB40CHG2_DIOCR|nr:LOW QUALITY PROTEIN: heterogeneous nuclear ribonucleoprotein Q-like [Dioscorea cayenensis subsp. rotundata]
MRTRNADSPKPPAGKKTPPAKKGAVPSPKSTAGQKGAKGKQAAAKTQAKVEEAPGSVEEKKMVKAPEKKSGGKGKSPLGAKAVAVVVVEKAEEVAEETLTSIVVPILEVMESKEGNKPGQELNLEPVLDYKDAAGGEEQRMEEDSEVVAVEEAVEGDEVVEEEAGGEGEGEGDEGDDDKGARMEEQIEISNMAKARMIKKEQEIFVGGLDRDAVEDDLKKVFERVGEVVEIRLHKDFNTNKNKGFAFVKFASKEQAAKALTELKNPMIRGKRCGVAVSEDNDTLFLGNICNTWTKEAIKNKLKEYCVDGVERITLVADSQNEGLSRGFAFLEFSCHAEAMLAYKRLQKPDVIFGHHERTAKVAFAEPLHEPDPEVMSQVKSVFIDGLPPYWDEDRVKEQFKEYGEIERVALARNMSKARRNDFGFVNFTTHEAAVACANGVSDTELGDGRSKMKARARLANPFPKTQAVKGGMSGGYRIAHFGFGRGGFGRGGFGRGGHFQHRAGFRGGRGFHLRGRGRGGRFSFTADNSLEVPHTEFHSRRPFGFRGGRRGSAPMDHNVFDGGRGRGFPVRRPPLMPGEFDRPFSARHFNEDPYYFADGGHGIKRPFSMMEHDPGYLNPGSRPRPRYDRPDPLSGGSRYSDTVGMAGSYASDYYGSDYGGGPYSSLYGGGEHSQGGYFY